MSEPTDPIAIPIPQDSALRVALAEEADHRDKLMGEVVRLGAEALAQELAQGKSERLLSYLDFAARFPRYSFHNHMLIRAQCPEATFVASAKKWNELGYLILKGERSIRIWAPRPYKYARTVAKQDDAGQTLEVEKEFHGTYFIAVPVFDASQIAGVNERPLPTFFSPLGHDGADLADRLEAAIRAEGVDIVHTRRTQGAEGISTGGTIALKTSLDGTNRFLTLLHEEAHELLHWDEEGKGKPQKVQECEAEAVSYIVARRFGIHNPFSSDYLQHFGNDAATLMAQLDRISKAARHIIELLELETPLEIAHAEAASMDATKGDAQKRATHARRGSSHSRKAHRQK